MSEIPPELATAADPNQVALRVLVDGHGRPWLHRDDVLGWLEQVPLKGSRRDRRTMEQMREQLLALLRAASRPTRDTAAGTPEDGPDGMGPREQR
jgi:hypothetical protein